MGNTFEGYKTSPQIIPDGVEVRRWAEYFEKVLNVNDVNGVKINVDGDRRMNVLGELNESATSID